MDMPSLVNSRKTRNMVLALLDQTGNLNLGSQSRWGAQTGNSITALFFCFKVGNSRSRFKIRSFTVSRLTDCTPRSFSSSFLSNGHFKARIPHRLMTFRPFPGSSFFYKYSRCIKHYLISSLSDLKAKSLVALRLGASLSRL